MSLAAPASLCFVVAGPLQVWVGSDTGGAMEFLGWTEAGVDIDERVFTSELHSDRTGGPEGAPEDYQLFGNLDDISLPMRKWDAAVMARFNTRLKPGVTRTMGMLLGCASAQQRVLLYNATGFIRNYPFITHLQPVTIGPIGSQASRTGLRLSGNSGTSVAGVSFRWDSRISLTAYDYSVEPTAPYA